VEDVGGDGCGVVILKRLSDALMAGDRVSSDIQGAQACGMKAALLRTGEFQPADLEGAIQPDYLFDSIVQILGLFPPD